MDHDKRYRAHSVTSQFNFFKSSMPVTGIYSFFHSFLKNFVIVHIKKKPVAKFIVPGQGEKVDSGLGFRQATQAGRQVRQSQAGVNYIPHSGTIILATGLCQFALLHLKKKTRLDEIFFRLNQSGTCSFPLRYFKVSNKLVRYSFLLHMYEQYYGFFITSFRSLRANSGCGKWMF